MSAGYVPLKVEGAAEEGVIALSCRLENQSAQQWKPSDGLALGWQVYDPESSLFIQEGEWIPLKENIPPGGYTDFAFRLQIPPYPGTYRIYVSLRSPAGWFFARGLPMLVVDARVDDFGRVYPERTRITTLRRLRLLNVPDSLRRIAQRFVSVLWGNRALISSMVKRDLQARYRGSFGDVLWTVLNPVLLMATYFFVFGVVLQARFANDPSSAGFALYFLAGMLPWLAFAEAVGRAPASMLEHRNFIKKLLFPVDIVPVTQTLAALITEAFAVLIFIGFVLLTRGSIPVTACWFPAILIPQVLFTLGAAWFFSALGVFVRDLGQIMGYVLTLWFFLTPICYPETQIPAGAMGILGKNPIYTLVRSYRAIFLENQAPAFASTWKLWLLSVLVCAFGFVWFQKLRKTFADVI
ncbi:MAG: ABC transporter permease [Bryobacteraceae bacterium]|nr:ABC transporter permease [Bryobacterales bacterium]MEB2360456.1 ABC transporter permease [Bryobacterales bacterium]NUN02057.1 ABC transporter permease [Bryobacteraceae bacterium]